MQYKQLITLNLNFIQIWVVVLVYISPQQHHAAFDRGAPSKKKKKCRRRLMPKSVGVRGDLLVNSGIVYLRLYIELFRVFLSLLEVMVA
jgi:hypothetical protein